MALSLSRINRIFEKAFSDSPSPPVLRKARPFEGPVNEYFEGPVNEYGEKYVWARDNGAHQATHVYVTLNAAIAGTLEDFWEDWHTQKSWEKLTAAELEALRSIASNVTRLIAKRVHLAWG